MKKDRKVICEIISEMLDNPDEYGIYPTSNAYDKLETLVNDRRVKAIGWIYADVCIVLDNKEDYRQKDVPEILERALIDLAKIERP